jgi:hypothetical protein
LVFSSLAPPATWAWICLNLSCWRVLYFPIFHQTEKFCWVPVAHSCNPSYSGGRDQEDCVSKAAWANSSRHSISKNPSQK